MKKIIPALTVIFVFSFLLPSFVLAKKLLPHLQENTSTSTKTASTTASGGRVKTSVKFRGDRRAIIVSLSNLSAAKKVDYLLSYNTRGMTQGAAGTIIPAAEDSSSHELLFGTCSKGICRYDAGITNARLTITSILANGSKVIKRYKIRV